MKNQSETRRSLDDIIAELGDDPAKMKAPKKRSVRDAIIGLRERVGSKVFTKRDLQNMIEAAYPELVPVKMVSLDASMGRAKEYLECLRKGSPNVYCFKQAN